ncbi:hypothetical protein L2E82_13702 [Cichorium intybus]|uniref:Uncharacterized protein n=1 Tax=Cichorium intybus TaxID=13427 RepID=A0ACB9EYK8_CICIN|nr:hypothetical protein L2E82_13702 [Cichorium intybus]
MTHEILQGIILCPEEERISLREPHFKKNAIMGSIITWECIHCIELITADGRGNEIESLLKAYLESEAYLKSEATEEEDPKFEFMECLGTWLHSTLQRFLDSQGELFPKLLAILSVLVKDSLEIKDSFQKMVDKHSEWEIEFKESWRSQFVMLTMINEEGVEVESLVRKTEVGRIEAGSGRYEFDTAEFGKIEKLSGEFGGTFTSLKDAIGNLLYSMGEKSVLCIAALVDIRLRDSLINNVFTYDNVLMTAKDHLDQGLAILQELCSQVTCIRGSGRIVNSIGGAAVLLWLGSWHLCVEAAVLGVVSERRRLDEVGDDDGGKVG